MTTKLVLQPNWSTRSFGLGIGFGSIITMVAISMLFWLLGIHVSYTTL